MYIDLIAIVIAVVVNVAVLWVCFTHGLHHNLAVSIVLAGGVTALLSTVHPALATLPTWAMLIVWCMLAIGLYVAPPHEHPNVLDEFFGGDL